jgi:hypothetical protein
MKRQLCLNRKLYEMDLVDQNKYLGNKIDSIKPAINSNIRSLKYINDITKSFSKRQSTYIF